MFSGAITPHFAFYDASHHQQSSPSRFFPASNVNSRPDTASSGPFSHSPSPHSVIPSLRSPAHPRQGYRNIPLPPSPGDPPFTSSPSMANHENAQKSDAVEGRYISRYGQSTPLDRGISNHTSPSSGPDSPSASNPFDPRTPSKSEPTRSIKAKDSWPSLTDALTGKKPLLCSSPSAPIKGEFFDMGADSPLRGDAAFFMPRVFGYKQQASGTSGYFGNGVQERKDSGIPLPRNQVQFATETSSPRQDASQGGHAVEPRQHRDSVATIIGPTRQQGSLATITGHAAPPATAIHPGDAFQADEDMYHLLPAFSPFNDYLDSKNTALKPPPGLDIFNGSPGMPSEVTSPDSTALFSPFYPDAGEPKTRSLLPSFKTTATSTSIWSMDAVPKQSPFSPAPAVSDTNASFTGDKVENWRHHSSPFASNGGENRPGNAVSLESLWESPFKQTAKTAPSARYADYDSPSFLPNGLNAATISGSTAADDIYAPSLKNRSTTGYGADEISKLEPHTMASVPLPPPPGLPIVGSVAGYTNDLLSIRELEEKMALLREQSSGLAGDLIQQAARIQNARLDLENRWSNGNHDSQALTETPSAISKHHPLKPVTNLTDAEDLPPSGSIIPVLLEGSADLFHASAIQKGAAGGEQVAIELLSRVKDEFEDVFAQSTAFHLIIHVVVSMKEISDQLVQSGIIGQDSVLRDFFEGFSCHANLCSITWCFNGDQGRDRLIGFLGLYWKTMKCSSIILAVNENLGFQAIQSFLEAQEARPVRLYLCNPNLMASANASVAFSRFKVPGIIVSQNTLEIAVDSIADDDEDDRLSSCISEGKAAIEEDWEHPVTASSSSDGEPWTPNVEAPGLSAESTRTSEIQTGQYGRQDASDAFTPVIGRQKKNSHISKLGVRLAVVTSDEFARFHKSTPKRTKARSGKSFRGISSLKANMAATAMGTATYREVDYQNMKKLNPRPCHKHYLSVKGCPNGDCAFGHHYELTQSELLAVRVLAKEMPCPYHLNGGCPQNVSCA